MRTIKNPSGLDFNLQESSILLGWRGSITHGTYRPSHEPNSIDDKDIMGVFVAPSDYYFGLKKIETMDWDEESGGILYDYVAYEVRKFINLLIKSNPNVISLLWLNDEHYIKRTEYGQLLIDNRDLFSTKKAYYSFVGYAHGQLHRMTHAACKGYMGEKRKRLVEKFGYDTKNAAHLIRLLNMGIEFLLTGKLQVMRPDARRLLDIKDGKFTLKEIQDEASDLFEKAKEALLKSELPMKPDVKQINEICKQITMGYHNDFSKRSK